MKPTGATKEGAGHSPLPWHVFEGGNFIKIATEGYEQYVKEHQYLGGPFSVASIEHYATESYQSNHDRALANAQLIVTAVNERERLRELLKATAHAMRSYQCGNSSPDLADEIQLAVNAALNEVEG